MRSWLAALAGTALAVVACDRTSSGETAPSPSASAIVPTPSASWSSPPSASSSAPRAPLQLLKFRFTSGIHNKEPEDELTAAEPTQRVYGHLTVRNRAAEPRKLTMTFRVRGERRTTLDLEVAPSWSYRTWGFNTLRKGDDGDLSIEVVDDAGNLLVDEKLPIKSKSTKKPP